MPFVRPGSVPFIAAARTLPKSTRRADAAAATLRADYERWSRLVWGVVAFITCAFGLLLAGAMIDLLVGYAMTSSIVTLAVAVGVAGIVAAAAGLLVLLRLWRTGRALSRSAAIWLRVPYRLGVRDRNASGWLAPRVVDESAPILARLACCALLALVAVFGLSIVFYPGWSTMIATPGACVLVGIVAASCLVGQFGGVFNITRGLRERDPRWARAGGR